MFVVNFKLDFKKILIFCVVVALFIATIIEFGSKNSFSLVNSNISNYDYDFNDANYVQNLKTIHENIDENLGKTVHLIGFVYRLDDFKENYIVCGRSIVVDGEDKIAGILCDYKESSKLAENEWIEITGVISKGEYNGIMPIITIGTIKKVTAPANTFVNNT